jgi:hypothetical protein
MVDDSGVASDECGEISKPFNSSVLMESIQVGHADTYLRKNIPLYAGHMSILYLPTRIVNKVHCLVPARGNVISSELLTHLIYFFIWKTPSIYISHIRAM